VGSDFLDPMWHLREGGGKGALGIGGVSGVLLFLVVGCIFFIWTKGMMIVVSVERGGGEGERGVF